MILDELFTLIYYVGFTWQDARNLPVSIRRWLIKRFIKEVTRKDDNSPQPLKAAHTQTPETRLFKNSHRMHSPNRLNRPL
jgi:hypothetical protein